MEDILIRCDLVEKYHTLYFACVRIIWTYFISLLCSDVDTNDKVW